jgi:hypothetical protein
MACDVVEGLQRECEFHKLLLLRLRQLPAMTAECGPFGRAMSHSLADDPRTVGLDWDLQLTLLLMRKHFGIEILMRGHSRSPAHESVISSVFLRLKEAQWTFHH